MTDTMVEVRGRKVALIEGGRGEPLVYLHGFADVHGVAGEFQPFHLRLGTAARVIAPAPIPVARRATSSATATASTTSSSITSRSSTRSG